MNPFLAGAAIAATVIVTPFVILWVRTVRPK